MKNLILIIIIPIILVSCSNSRVAGNYTFKTECMGVELDGSQTLKAWGTGRNRLDAVEQAKKNAANDVLFKGIYEGKQDCQLKPIVLEVNARQKYEDYFNNFFSDGGQYKEYVLMKDERIFQKIWRDRYKSREGVTHGITVRVLRSELKKQLINDKIIK